MKMKMKIITFQNFWDTAKAVRSIQQSRPSLRRKKISNTQPNLTPKRAGKRAANKAQNQQKSGNNED